MIRNLELAVILVLFIIAGCSGPVAMDNDPIQLRLFALIDVEGGSGGQSVWIAEDRTRYVQLVEQGEQGEPRLKERRYKDKLSNEQYKELEQLLGKHNALSIKTGDRPAIPGEPIPILLVGPSKGKIAVVKKLRNDAHPDFDPIYNYALKLCRMEPDAIPIYEGEYEMKWRPTAFHGEFSK